MKWCSAPPERRSAHRQGSVVEFGRYSGWTLGQIKRADPEFLEWLMRVPAGRHLRDEIVQVLGRKSA